MPSNEMLVEAVEQQDLDTVQILLYQFSAEDLDLNTPDSRGLTPLDIAIMTNNIPIAKLLLKAGAMESPHCEYIVPVNIGHQGEPLPKLTLFICFEIA